MPNDNNRFLTLILSIIICASIGAEASLPPQTAKKQSSTRRETVSRASKSSGSKSSATKKKASATQTSGSAATKKSPAPKNSQEAKRRQEETQREIARTKEQIRLNEQQMKQELSDLNRLSADIQSGRKEVGQLQGKVASLQQEIGSLGAKIEEGERDLARMREEYLKAVKKMRLTKKNQSTLAFIFASENFNQAMRRIRYLRQFSEWKEKQSAAINAQIKTLADEKQRLDQVKEQETTALTRLETSQRSLEGKRREQEKLVDRLKQNGDMLQGHLRSKQAEANSLKESISSLIAQEEQARQKAKAEEERKAREKAEAERKAREKAAAEKAAAEKAAAEKAASDKKAAEDKKKEEKKKAQEKKAQEKKQKNSEKSSRRKKKSDTPKADTPAPAPPAAEAPAVAKPAVDKALGSSFAASKGALPRPVDGSWRVTNPFGRHSMPEMPEVVYDNPGIDAEVANGASAKAVYAGRVSGVYKVSGYGTVVIVNHGEYYTVYGNLSSVSVSVGSQVKPGQVLGKVGPDPDDPRHSSIHFEVWHGRDKQNPSSWLR